MTVLHKIPTSCKKIDKILEGGISNRRVSLIYGEAETGKTTLATQCAVNCARLGYKTLFVDCDGTFSGRRLSQIASRDFKDISKLIILMRPGTLSEQAVVIDRLEDYITRNFGLVVVDTFTSLYCTEVAQHYGRKFELNRELNRQMACLTQFAKTQRIVVLTTSQVRSVFNGSFDDVEPVATRVLKFWADTIIALKLSVNPHVVKAILERTPKRAKSLTCNLKIEETGIHEY